MTWYLIVSVFLVLLGAVNLAYQIFQMTKLDAESRGLKHPKFWGVFSLSGNGSGGLLLYLIGRRKYPSSMNEENKKIMHSRKKKAGVSLAFLGLATIVLFIISILEL